MQINILIRNKPDGKVQVYSLSPCEDGQWCCQIAGNLSSCCNNGKGSFTLRPGTIVSQQLQTAAIPSGQIPTQTVTSTETITPTQSITTGSSTALPLQSQCPQDHTIVIGASIGGGLGGALIASLLAICFILRRQRKRNQLQEQSLYAGGAAPQQAPTDMYSAGDKPWEPPGTRRAYVPEIDGRQVGGGSPPPAWAS